MQWNLLFISLVISSCCFGQVMPFSVDELLGKINPAKDTAFVQIDSHYTSKPEIYLRKPAYDAFVQMAEAAAADGIHLTILSATRNFNYQKGIWERKWKRTQYMGWQDLEKVKDIMQYSAMPGTSRHHWGTDIDLNALNNAYFESGEGLRVYEWLQQNARRYGFVQVYANKTEGRTGYNDEKWHWSYLPLAEPMLEQYNLCIKNNMINGFSGSEQAVTIDAVTTYVNGVYAPKK